MKGDVRLRPLTMEELAQLARDPDDSVELLPAPGPGWMWVMEDDGSVSLRRAVKTATTESEIP